MDGGGNGGGRRRRGSDKVSAFFQGTQKLVKATLGSGKLSPLKPQGLPPVCCVLLVIQPQLHTITDDKIGKSDDKRKKREVECCVVHVC